jgi:hypothetical protein
MGRWHMQQGMDELDKKMIHVLGGMEQDSVWFHFATQNIM